MNITIISLQEQYIEQACDIWNDIVEDGIAFPQTENLTLNDARNFFNEQTLTAIALDLDTNTVVGLYILHPNNVGRCGHICNASYAVKKGLRGHGIGEKLVKHCLVCAKQYDFKIMQFNAVVASNKSALSLYEKLGFVRLGVIPKGFLLKDGTYEDIIPHYLSLGHL